MRRKLVGVFLTFIMVLSLFPVTALAVTPWDETADTEWYNENGTTFTITTAEQLAGLAELVNQATNSVDFSGKTIQLGADIDLEGKEWTPIGSGTRDGSSYTGNSFKGTFDGAGHTISGLTISGDTSSADAAIGLFGVVDGGTVKNLTLTGVSISVDNGECVGGFIGLMVRNATASGLTAERRRREADGQRQCYQQWPNPRKFRLYAGWHRHHHQRR